MFPCVNSTPNACRYLGYKSLTSGQWALCNMFTTPLCVLDLPTELLCRIFSYLNVLDLYHCSLTCVVLRRVIEDSVELQLDMQLGINRMVRSDPLSCGPSLPTRLNELNRRQNAWKHLRLKLDDKYTSEFPGNAYGAHMYENVGGVFSTGSFQSISFIQLNSTSDREAPLTWSHSMEFPLREYTTDSTQDLMIVVEDAPEGSDFAFTSHMRTLTTNKPHPRTSMLTHDSFPRYLVDREFTSSWPPVTVQIAGDFVALLAREVLDGFGSFIEIWNWTKPAPPHRCEFGFMEHIDDMVFLSATTFLVTCPHSCLIELYDFDDPAVSYKGLTRRGRFSLPLLQLGCTYAYIFASSHPPASRTYSPIPSLEKSLFQPSPEDRICSICIPLRDASGSYVTYTLYIHIRVFLGSDPRVSSFLKESEVYSVPWDVWGPQNTRWCPSDWSGWRYASYGLRAIDSVVEPLDPEVIQTETVERRLRLWDFNSYTFSTSTSEDDAPLEAWRNGRVVKESSCIPASTTFMEDVESHLPYREVITEERFDITDVMMDENQIVLLKRVIQGLDKLSVLKI